MFESVGVLFVCLIWVFFFNVAAMSVIFCLLLHDGLSILIVCPRVCVCCCCCCVFVCLCVCPCVCVGVSGFACICACAC